MALTSLLGRSTTFDHQKSLCITSSISPTTLRYTLASDACLPPRHREVVCQEPDKMLDAGIITPSSSVFSFLFVIASKKDGKPRFLVDYGIVNRRVKANRWPLPKIEEIFDDLQGSKVSTILDLFGGYWQFRMTHRCKETTTFLCRYGIWKFEVIPFGLMNAPSTFQHKMEFIF